MLTVTVQMALWAFITLVSGVVACGDYDYMEKHILKPSLESNDSRSIDKRWYTISSDEFDTPVRSGSIWPSSTLPYCWENDETKSLLEIYLRDGWELWQAAGVPYAIDMGLYSDCPDVGTNGNRPPSEESKYLLMRYNTNGVFLTSIGFAMYSAGYGPYMTFDPTGTLATGSAASNMAHELGHAWGFFHEHQRPSFWASKANGGAEFGTGTHNQINFLCTNLKGYDTLLANNGVSKMNSACTNYLVAKSIGFSAMEILPFTHDESEDMGAGVFDWESIMLYGSTIGGQVNGGTVQNVYTKASDSSVVKINLVPSTRDVQRFKTMYKQSAPNPNPCLINQGCSAWKATFLRTKASCKNLVG